MARLHGKAIWQSSMARLYGKAIWQGSMARLYGKACLRRAVAKRRQRAARRGRRLEPRGHRVPRRQGANTANSSRTVELLLHVALRRLLRIVTIQHEHGMLTGAVRAPWARVAACSECNASRSHGKGNRG